MLKLSYWHNINCVYCTIHSSHKPHCLGSWHSICWSLLMSDSFSLFLLTQCILKSCGHWHTHGISNLVRPSHGRSPSSSLIIKTASDHESCQTVIFSVCHMSEKMQNPSKAYFMDSLSWLSGYILYQSELNVVSI